MKKINVAKLLKDCPQGMELDCTICNNVVTLEAVDTEEYFPIRVVSKAGFHHALTREGCVYEEGDAKCVIFPKGKTTWEGFQRPFKDGDVVTSVFQGVVQGTGIFDYEEQSEAWIHVCINLNNDFSTDGYLGHIYNLRHATEEEKQKLFNVIKANGYKWNEETKTLERLVEPRFKIGDRIVHKVNKTSPFIITEITNISYKGGNRYEVLIEQQDNFELVPKFDINTLVPFESRVLVRNSDSGFWKPAFWGIYEAEKTNEHQYRNYLTTEGFVRHCIPYNDETKHLLGTTDNCNGYYKTWE